MLPSFGDALETRKQAILFGKTYKKGRSCAPYGKPNSPLGRRDYSSAMDLCARQTVFRQKSASKEPRAVLAVSHFNQKRTNELTMGNARSETSGLLCPVPF
jgi:hypothetical protein